VRTRLLATIALVGLGGPSGRQPVERRDSSYVEKRSERPSDDVAGRGVLGLGSLSHCRPEVRIESDRDDFSGPGAGLSGRVCDQRLTGTFPIRRNPFRTPAAIPVRAGCLPASRGRDRERSWQTTPVTDPRMAGGGGDAADPGPEASVMVARRRLAGFGRVRGPRCHRSFTRIATWRSDVLHLDVERADFNHACVGRAGFPPNYEGIVG
jgi:hypothetical protein